MVEPLDIDHHPPVGLPERFHLPNEGAILFANGDEVRAIAHIQSLGTSLDRLVEQLSGPFSFGPGFPVSLVSVAPLPDRSPVDDIDTGPGADGLE